MISTFTGIEMGKRSLVASTQGLNTVGHNMANANTEGYSRQRVEFSAFEPIYVPGLEREQTPGQIGQGVSIDRIRRVRDELLEGRIVAQGSQGSYWETRDRYLSSLAQIYAEPGETSLRGSLDQFWLAWQELSAQPAELSARQAVLRRGETLVDAVRERFRQLSSVRDMVEGDVQGVVRQVNDITKQIAALNAQIVKSEAQGDDPNDLYDRRDLLVGKLSELIDITVVNRDPDEFFIHTKGMHLVQGRINRELALAPSAFNDGLANVVWKDSGQGFIPSKGKLGALLELRDVDIRGEIQKLDSFAINFMDLVNENHRAGYGLNGKTGLDFFVEHPFVLNIAGNYDADGDGAFDSTYLFRVTGANSLEPQAHVGLKGSLTLPGKGGPVTVAYEPTDTVADVIDRINNSGAEVAARLDREGRLSIKATPAEAIDKPDFVLRGIEDSGLFLAGYAGLLRESGPGGAFSYSRADASRALMPEADFAVAPVAHPSAWLEINPALFRDPTSVAAGFGVGGRPAESGDGSAALAIAGLRSSQAMIGASRTFDDYFAEAVADIGLKSEQAARQLESATIAMKDLTDARSAISGVNMDEEVALMMQYQHGYAAAARFITAVDEMIDIIINRMGV
jgi:flagellar hook-associated protein 1 FlgK